MDSTLKQCNKMIKEVNKHLNIKHIENNTDLCQLVLSRYYYSGDFCLSVEIYKDHPEKNIIKEIDTLDLNRLYRTLKTFFKTKIDGIGIEIETPLFPI